jgi:hypothetical protein
MRRRSWCLIAALVLAGTSCGHRRGTAADTGTPGVENPVHLNVINHYTLPVDVFVIAAGTTYRMGTVHPGVPSHFVLREAMVMNGPVELVAQPAGTESPVRSGQLLLAPGDVVDFEIESHLLNSTATVHH